MEDTKKIRKQLTAIIGVIIAILIIPLVGEFIHNHGSIPKDLFEFPPTSPQEKAGFSLPVFIVFAASSLFGIVLYIYPWIFGFKRPPKEEISEKVKKEKLPLWFWIGMLLFVTTALIMWGKFSQPKIIINFSVIPLFWGFSFIIDGLVYRRNSGNSIISNMPRTIIGIGIASISGWLIFEYLNFFVNDNWYYPMADLVTTSEFYVYALVGSTGLMPMAFEMYSLLNTFKGLQHRYSFGRKITLPRKLQYAILLFTLGITFIIGYFPNQMFFIIWLAPLIIFSILLDILGLWTPFKPIAQKGDWTPLALICLAEFIMGFLCEFWNYLSAFHNPLLTHNPDYWVYSIPYVNILHVFEMPMLGLFGYIPFGAYIWVWWIVVAFTLNIPPYIVKKDSYTGF
ncbi:MAG: hypothetical protein JEZ09_18165 [Salinivirgaceae bacterium]|nr:hypothetical protein [Salinivirgaceae bacterium]